MSKEKILERAAAADCLSMRITENVAAQQVDLNNWIFSNINVSNGSKVLELCCGTGAQTSHLVERVGNTGRVVSVDISRKALDSIMGKTLPEYKSRLTLIESSLDDLSGALKGSGGNMDGFDMVFCAYGLYYGKDARSVMNAAMERLKPDGSMVIVGPFGPNNGALFSFLEQQQVKIPEYVRHTSQDFMCTEVIPWATVNFPLVKIRRLVNPVCWQSAQNVISYWRNSTFFDVERLPQVQAGLEEHFRTTPEFRNEKWIMLMEACHG
ncbi:MAG: class I SAM-dependent methyltransferase [Victivallales bacterium]